ncbi:tripartite tricarboxylate transporter TctB family protein [Agromyces bauzanensis]
MSTQKAPLLSRFRLSSLVVVLIGVAFLVMSLQLPIGTFQTPGAGMWPMLVSIALIVAAVFLLITEPDGADYEPLTRRTLISVLGFLWIAAFVVMFQAVGFTFASLIFSVVWLRFLARESWKFTLIASPVFTIAFVLIFSVALGVPVPHDPVLSFITGGRF